MNTKSVVRCLGVFLAVWAVANPAPAAVTFYQQFNNTPIYNSGPGDIGGNSYSAYSYSVVPGYGPSGTAIHFGASGQDAYAPANTYLSGFDTNTTIGANTIRVLYKPDYSGNPTDWSTLISAARLDGYQGIGIINYSGLPTLHAVIDNNASGTYYASVPGGFTWDSNTWYYIGASFDASGGILYVRPLTENSTASSVSLAFPASNWGAPYSTGQYPFDMHLRVGAWSQGTSADFNSSVANQSARGAIDEALIVSGQKYSLTDFANDFQDTLLVPEPGVVSLLLLGLGLVAARRKR